VALRYYVFRNSFTFVHKGGESQKLKASPTSLPAKAQVKSTVQGTVPPNYYRLLQENQPRAPYLDCSSP
jgi:hypothetical protein